MFTFLLVFFSMDSRLSMWYFRFEKCVITGRGSICLEAGKAEYRQKISNRNPVKTRNKSVPCSPSMRNTGTYVSTFSVVPLMGCVRTCVRLLMLLYVHRHRKDYYYY